jgi:hypothetical protein
MTAPEPTQPLTDEELDEMRDVISGGTETSNKPDSLRIIGGWMLAEVDRLRAENTTLRASLDQFRSFPDNPGPGKWSVSYRMGYTDAGRDVRALVRALDQSGEGQANG